MYFILTIIGLMLTFDVAWWWYADRRLRPLRNALLWRSLLGLFHATQILALLWLILGAVLAAGEEPRLPAALMSLVFVWHLIVLPATLVALLVGGILKAIRVAGASLIGARSPRGSESLMRDHPDESPVAVERSPTTADKSGVATRELAPSRRTFLRAAAAAAPPLLATAGAARGLSQLDAFRVRRIELTIASLPPNLDGLTIAHVSDSHVGDFTTGRTLVRIAEETNRLRADLVLLTGDLINRRLSDLPAALDMVRRMDPRHGLFMCEGNHDLFEGRDEFARRVRAAGVPLLANGSALLRLRSEQVQLLGLRWGSADGRNRRAGGDEVIAGAMPPLLAQRQPGAFPILLAHHPHAFDPAAAAGIPLTLSGHTHGGQLNAAPSFGFGRLMYRYWSGAYANGNSRLVVSNGVGNWFPLRVGAPAEIIHITLHAAGT